MSKVVPEGWQISSVEDLLTPDCLFSDGDWVESKDQDPAGTNRLLQLADIGDGRFVNKSNRFMNDEQFNRLNCTQLQEGDVLIARMPEPIGRACILPRLDNRLATVVDIAILRPSAVDSYWLMSVINSAGFRTKIEEQSSGTTRTRIGRTALSKIKLLFPPLPEQKKIASILTSVDEVIENTQRQIDKLQDLKKATMNELLTKGIGHTEFKDSELGRIPKSWEVKTLMQFSAEEKNTFVNGPFGSDLLSSEMQDSGIPVIYVQDISDGKYLRKTSRFVTETKADALIACNTFNGDIIVQKVGDPPAGAALFIAEDRAIVTQDVIRIRVASDVQAGFVTYLLNSHWAEKEVRKIAIEGTRTRVSLTEYKQIKLPKPPMEEQVKIASMLSSIDDMIQIKQKRVFHKKSLKKSLMQDLLTGKVRVTVN